MTSGARPDRSAGTAEASAYHALLEVGYLQQAARRRQLAAVGRKAEDGRGLREGDPSPEHPVAPDLDDAGLRLVTKAQAEAARRPRRERRVVPRRESDLG